MCQHHSIAQDPSPRAIAFQPLLTGCAPFPPLDSHESGNPVAEIASIVAGVFVTLCLWSPAFAGVTGRQIPDAIALTSHQDLSKVFDRFQMPLILSLSQDTHWCGLWFDKLTMIG